MIIFKILFFLYFSFVTKQEQTKIETKILKMGIDSKLSSIDNTILYCLFKGREKDQKNQRREIIIT